MLDLIKSICASREDKTHLDISEFLLLAPTSNGCVSNKDNKIIKAAVFEFEQIIWQKIVTLSHSINFTLQSQLQEEYLQPMSYNRSAYESPETRELYVKWILHAVFTEDVTGRMEVLKIFIHPFINISTTTEEKYLQTASVPVTFGTT